MARLQALTANSNLNGTGYVLADSFVTGAVTAGSLLTVGIVTTSATSPVVTSITDDRGNTWSRADNVGNPAGTAAELWYAPNAAAGATTITINTAAPNYVGRHYVFQEFDGIMATSPLDKHQVGYDAGTTHDTAATAVTAYPDELVVSIVGTDNYNASYSAGSGYSGLVHSASGTPGVYRSIAGQYKEIATAAAQTGLFTTAAGCESASVVATFRKAATNVPPDAPTNVAVLPSDSQNDISCDAMFSADYYEFWSSATIGGTYTKISGASTPTVPAFSHTGLTNGTAYYYKVKAVNEHGASGFSSVVSGVPNVGGGGGLYDWHPNGIKPNLTTAYMRSSTRAKMDLWFGYTLTTDGCVPNSRLPGVVKRIKVPDQGFYPDTSRRNGTVSEGQSYAALFKVILSHPDLEVGVFDANGRADLDALYRFYDGHKNAHGFMNWHIYSDNTVGDYNGASDGDFDMAEALVMASLIHGDDGAINYGAEADALIQAIEDWEFVPEDYGTVAHRNLMTNGDGWGFAADNYMPDYSRMAFFMHWEKWLRARGQTDRADRWVRIMDKNFDHIDNYWLSLGYTAGVPDRQTRSYGSLGGVNDMVTYNSVRLGFGWMVMYLWWGADADPRAKEFMDIIANRFKAVFGTGSNVKAPNYPSNLNTHEGYSNATGWGYAGSVSLGQAGNQTFATELFNALLGSSEYNASYFGGGIAAYALCVMSGLMQPFEVPSPDPTLDAPTGITITRLDGALGIAWDTVADATGYEVWQSSTELGVYSLVGSPATTSFTATGLTNTSTYYFKLKATGVDAISEFSAATWGTPIAAPAVTATVAGPTSVFVQCVVVPGAFNTYSVYRSATLNGTYTKLITHQGTMYLDEGLTEGTTYYYKMTAGGPEGPLTPVGVAATPEDPPAVPTGLSVVVSGSAHLTISWDAMPTATSYDVEWKIGAGGTFTFLSGTTGTTFSQSGLTIGTEYFYRVRSVRNGINRSEYSSPDSAVAAEAPAIAGEVWNGTDWVSSGEVWNGSAWIASGEVWNGTDWEPS